MLTAYRSTRLLSAIGTLLFVCASLNATAQTPLTASELLAELKSRDAAFDKLRLNYRRFYTMTLEGPDWRANAPDDPAWKDPRLKEFIGLTRRLTLHEVAIVRGSEVTFVTELDKADVDYFKTVPMGIGIPSAYGFQSNIGKVQRMYSTPELVPTNPHSSEVWEQPVADSDVIQEKWMSTELAFGIGYGKRIHEIQSITENTDGWTIEATMALTELDESVAQLILDREFVVRSARLVWFLPDGGETHTAIETSGTVHTGGITLANTGHYKQTVYSEKDLAENNQRPYVRSEIEVAFDSLRRDLTDNEYATMTTLGTIPDSAKRNGADQ